MDEGKIIHHIRNERGITQEALASGICSVRHLRDVEKGNKEPSHRLLSQLTERLNVDIHLLVNEDVRKYGLELYKDLQKMERLCMAWSFGELEEVLINLEKNYFFQSTLLKKIKYYKAICNTENHKSYVESKKILLGAIGLMTIDQIENFLKHYRDKIDLNIVNALAVNESLQNNMKNAINIYDAIKNHLTQHDALISAFGVKVLYNRVKMLFQIGEYKESEDSAVETLIYCQQIYDYPAMAGCYYYIAESNKELGNNEIAQSYYKKYIYLRYLFNDYEKLMDTIVTVIDENDIILDRDVVGEVFD